MKRDWTAAREKVEREGRCRVCFRATFGLEAAHIIPRSVGGGQDPDGIVPLCSRCHRAYDAHKLELLPYLTVDEQAEAVRAARGIENARARLVLDGEAA